MHLLSTSSTLTVQYLHDDYLPSKNETISDFLKSFSDWFSKFPDTMFTSSLTNSENTLIFVSPSFVKNIIGFVEVMEPFEIEGVPIAEAKIFAKEQEREVIELLLKALSQYADTKKLFLFFHLPKEYETLIEKGTYGIDLISEKITKIPYAKEKLCCAHFPKYFDGRKSVALLLEGPDNLIKKMGTKVDIGLWETVLAIKDVTHVEVISVENTTKESLKKQIVHAYFSGVRKIIILYTGHGFNFASNTMKSNFVYFKIGTKSSIVTIALEELFDLCISLGFQMVIVGADACNMKTKEDKNAELYPKDNGDDKDITKIIKLWEEDCSILFSTDLDQFSFGSKCGGCLTNEMVDVIAKEDFNNFCDVLTRAQTRLGNKEFFHANGKQEGMKLHVRVSTVQSLNNCSGLLMYTETEDTFGKFESYKAHIVELHKSYIQSKYQEECGDSFANDFDKACKNENNQGICITSYHHFPRVVIVGFLGLIYKEKENHMPFYSLEFLTLKASSEEEQKKVLHALAKRLETFSQSKKVPVYGYLLHSVYKTELELFKERNFYLGKNSKVLELKEENIKEEYVFFTFPNTSNNKKNMAILLQGKDNAVKPIGVRRDMEKMKQMLSIEDLTLVNVMKTSETSFEHLKHQVRTLKFLEVERVVIYYSGHGLSAKNAESADFPSIKLKEETVCIAEIFELYKQQFGMLVVGVDSCFSEEDDFRSTKKVECPLPSMQFREDSKYTKLWEENIKLIFSSCSKGEKSYGNRSGGIFTQLLVENAGGAAWCELLFKLQVRLKELHNQNTIPTSMTPQYVFSEQEINN